MCKFQTDLCRVQYMYHAHAFGGFKHRVYTIIFSVIAFGLSVLYIAGMRLRTLPIVVLTIYVDIL